MTSNVVEMDAPPRSLRLLAKALVAGAFNEKDAYAQLLEVFQMGSMSGQAKAYRAQRRALEREAEERLAKREAPNG